MKQSIIIPRDRFKPSAMNIQQDNTDSERALPSKCYAYRQRYYLQGPTQICRVFP